MNSLIEPMDFHRLMAIFLANGPRAFTPGDWRAFAGCDGNEPMIAELSDEEGVIVLDPSDEDVGIQAFEEDGEMVFSFLLSRYSFDVCYGKVLS